MRFLLSIVFCVFISTVYSQTYNGPDKEIASILIGIDSFSHYFVTNQTDKLVECYTQNGKIMPSGFPILEGRESIDRYWRPNGKSQTIYHNIQPEEITVIGDTAYDFGYYEGKTRLEDGRITMWKGKYVILWKKVNGKWKIDVDIWNNVNLPQEINMFQSLLDSVYQANQDAVGMMVHIEMPSKGISWSSASGYNSKEKNEYLNPNQPVYIASNTKTFVAATIMKLVENRALSIDDNIKTHLPKPITRKFEKAGYNTKTITVKHLLSHTSGINDYVDKTYFSTVDSLPQKQWTKEEQIQRTIGMGEPFATPGTEYAYGDINYVLLAEIIEAKTKKPYYTAMRDILDYDRLGLDHTWLALLEEEPEVASELAHQYNKLNWDSRIMNPSWDLYGGGGLISTSKDLSIFFQALFNGEIINDMSLVDLMHTYVLPVESSNYGLGMMMLDFDGHEAYYHGGYWGTNAIYLPEFDMSVASFTLDRQNRKLNSDLLKAILKKMKVSSGN